QLRQGAEHVRTFQQVWPGQGECRLAAHDIVVKQNVNIHGARRPPGSIPRTPAQLLYGVQMLDHRAQRKGGSESGHAIDEVVPLETNSCIAIPRRESHIGEEAFQLTGGLGNVLFRVDIASDGDVNLRHSLSALRTEEDRLACVGSIHRRPLSHGWHLACSRTGESRKYRTPPAREARDGALGSRLV